MDSDKLDKPAHAKSYIVDTSPKCAEYLFQKNGCSSFLIRYCLKNPDGGPKANLMNPFPEISSQKISWGTSLTTLYYWGYANFVGRQQEEGQASSQMQMRRFCTIGLVCTV